MQPTMHACLQHKYLGRMVEEEPGLGQICLQKLSYLKGCLTGQDVSVLLVSTCALYAER